MKKAFIALTSVVILAGCGTTLNGVSRGINSYCAATTDMEREVIRVRVDQKIAPNRIAIECHKE